MRKFTDLNITPVKSDINSMLKHAVKLGYQNVAVNNLKIKIEDPFLKVVSRCSLHPKNSKELFSGLKANRNKFTIISVLCKTKRLANQAINDSRVDLLNYPNSLSQRYKNYFDKKQASLASDSNCCLEICFTDFLYESNGYLDKRLKIYRREIQNANKKNIPIIFSSGAQSIMEMREPYALSAMSSLFDINESNALNMVSLNPNKIIEKNQRKLSEKYVSPGVWRVN